MVLCQLLPSYLRLYAFPMLSARWGGALTIFWRISDCVLGSRSMVLHFLCLASRSRPCPPWRGAREYSAAHRGCCTLSWRRARSDLTEPCDRRASLAGGGQSPGFWMRLQRGCACQLDRRCWLSRRTRFLSDLDGKSSSWLSYRWSSAEGKILAGCYQTRPTRSSPGSHPPPLARHMLCRTVEIVGWSGPAARASAVLSQESSARRSDRRRCLNSCSWRKC